MKKINKKVSSVIKQIKNLYGNSGDLNTRVIKVHGVDVGVLFMESSSGPGDISDRIIKSTYFLTEENVDANLYNLLKNYIFNSQVLTTKDFDEFAYYLSSGFTIIVVDGHDEAIVMETRAELDRGVTESTSEPILRGPKDSFTESHAKNLGLVRKRIKDPNLWFDEVKVGVRTQTRVSIAYLNGVADKNAIMEIKKILSSIDIDGILDSGNVKEYLLKDKSVFPQILSTERPDLVCQSILNGKIALIVENTPFVLVLPNVFIDFMHTSEDQYQKPLNISFTRALKVMALIVTLFTPAIYIAITTFDQTAVPDKLLISLAVQRSGVPFPTFFEIILLMIIFEILREGDIRSPSNMGTSMSIVGALVLGQAAVDAGIVSPIAVIVIAITSICSLIFNDIDFMNGIRAWRFIFILAATFFGLIGVVASGIIWLLKLSSLESFGVPFMAPFSPLIKSGQKDAVVRFPLPKIFKRPLYLHNDDIIKQGGQDEK